MEILLIHLSVHYTWSVISSGGVSTELKLLSRFGADRGVGRVGGVRALGIMERV
jgi:hypothetical protein